MATDRKKKQPGLRLRIIRRGFDLRAISNLLESVGMRARKPGELKRALKNSSDVVIVSSEDELVGFGRMISDNTYYATFWDIAVKPEFQKRGIGTQILRALLKRARRKKLYMIGLFTASRNRSFYERIGFRFFNDVHAMTTLEQPSRRSRQKTK